MPRFISWMGLAILAIVCAGMWAVSATANWAHALHLMGASEWRYIIAGASAGSDVLKVMAGFALLAAFRQRLWAILLAALLVWSITTAWSIRSAIGFAAVTLDQAAVTRSVDSATENSIKSQLDAEVRALSWLSQQTMTGPRGVAEIGAGVEKARASIERLREQLKASGGKIDDPTGAFMARFGVSPNTVQIGTAVMILLLLEVTSNFGFMLLGAFRPTTPPDDKVKTKRDDWDDLPFADEPTAANDDMVKGAPLPSYRRAELRERLARKPSESHVDMWLNTVPRKEALRLAHLHREYEAYCFKAGREPLSAPQLGVELINRGWVRSRDARGMIYYTHSAPDTAELAA